MKYLIETCKVSLESLYKNALPNAAERGDLLLVSYLVEVCNVNIEVKNNGKNTPLQIAVINGRTEVAKYLVGKNAKITDEIIDSAKSNGLKSYLKFHKI